MDTNRTNSLQNYTLYEANWAFLPIFQISCSCMAAICNAYILYAFITNISLRTPFNIHLIFLLSLNLINAIVICPLDTMALLYDYWVLGTNVCLAYNYLAWTTQSAVPHTHVIIAVNRIWAVYFPIHYRQNISKKTVVITCSVMITYVGLVNAAMLTYQQVMFPINDSEEFMCKGWEQYFWRYNAMDGV